MNRKQRRAKKSAERKLGMKVPDEAVVFLPTPEHQTTYQGHKRHKGGHFGDKFQG